MAEHLTITYDHSSEIAYIDLDPQEPYGLARRDSRRNGEGLRSRRFNNSVVVDIDDRIVGIEIFSLKPPYDPKLLVIELAARSTGIRSQPFAGQLRRIAADIQERIVRL